MHKKEKKYDYIIVGAGSAGCVLAARLSEDRDVSVLLLEAGSADWRLDWRTQMPAALTYPQQSTRYNWAYQTEEEENLNRRRLNHSRGKGLGGSSLINGMVYIRGNPLDYEGWSSLPSLQDWSYAHCLPYFRKAETYDKGENAYHGAHGPLHVTSPKSPINPLFEAFIEAGEQAGYPRTEDLNGYRQEGFGYMDRTTTERGRRCSTALAYLDQTKNRNTCIIIRNAYGDRLLFNGSQVIGIRYIHHGQTFTAYADREVIICNGAIATPQLLLRSGIGHGDELHQHHITPIIHLPGVGANLQDHLELYIQYQCHKPVSLYPALQWWNKLRIGIQWYAKGTGLGASNHFEAGGFICSDEAFQSPNLQYHFLPLAMNYDGSNIIKMHSFQCHVGSMRSPSRGSIKLKSTNPFDKPYLHFNYMSHETDWAELRSAIRLTRTLIHQRAFDEFRGKEIQPGKAMQTDQDIDDFIKNHVETALHPCGTCKMGSVDDPMSVVDAQGRVHGLSGLRVVDASIMPTIVTGNLNAPVIMMAEKIADQIRGHEPLPTSQAPFYIKPNPNILTCTRVMDNEEGRLLVCAPNMG